MPKLRTIPADPEQWSAQSKNSVAYLFTREYSDISYKCWSCCAPSVFTAEDQKYTYEVKKASIDQQRVLCQTCWTESNRLQSLLKEKDRLWSESKRYLQTDQTFLSEWLDLLQRLEHYIRYKPEKAKKNMLKKLIERIHLEKSGKEIQPK
jgi:hypothetical protein